jgi:hypothetical protein
MPFATGACRSLIRPQTSAPHLERKVGGDFLADGYAVGSACQIAKTFPLESETITYHAVLAVQ